MSQRELAVLVKMNQSEIVEFLRVGRCRPMTCWCGLLMVSGFLAA